MSTKTIALETSVYDRLAGEKRPSESFTKTIARLLEHRLRGTCAEAVADSAEFWKSIPTDSEAAGMEDFVRRNRQETAWDVERLE